MNFRSSVFDLLRPPVSYIKSGRLPAVYDPGLGAIGAGSDLSPGQTTNSFRPNSRGEGKPTRPQNLASILPLRPNMTGPFLSLRHLIAAYHRSTRNRCQVCSTKRSFPPGPPEDGLETLDRRPTSNGDGGRRRETRSKGTARLVLPAATR